MLIIRGKWLQFRILDHKTRLVILLLAMKYFWGVFALALLVGLVAAKPQPAADFRERVRRALKVKGISLDKVLSSQELEGFMKEQVGDIWSNCGKTIKVFVLTSS